MMEKSANEPGVDPAFLSASLKHLEDMDRYCRGAVCRHRALVRYFGQDYPASSCNACDLCLGDTEEVPDAATVAKKILSCVARVKEGFGINHVVSVLRGENNENVLKRGHDKLTTFGLLKGNAKPEVRDWIYQLIGQGVLIQVGDEYPLLRLNPSSWEVMKGQRSVRLVQLVRRKKGEKPGRSRAEAVSWEGVDQPLFDALRTLRRQLAVENQVPPYVIFSDTTLRELAQIRPSTLERMRSIYGVGDAKLRRFGEGFLTLLNEQCSRRALSRDVVVESKSLFSEAPKTVEPPRVTPRHVIAFDLFRQHNVIEDVMHQMNRSRGTVVDYLMEYIRSEKPASITTWVPDETYQRVAAASRQVGTERLKPIFLVLGESVDYDTIRLVVTHLQTHEKPDAAP
jgi:ATP-dependent DNA helicase RecQ